MKDKPSPRQLAIGRAPRSAPKIIKSFRLSREHLQHAQEIANAEHDGNRSAFVESLIARDIKRRG